ncbi:MAG: aminopeptidase P family protein [Acidobacteria bacterium]|nr:aminopeptidase P family protein [Acidobacteriota bacterium]
MNKRTGILAVLAFGLLLGGLAPGGETADRFPAVMKIQDQITVVNRITAGRLDTILPGLMREAGFDMWIMPENEDHPDAVLRTMVPYDTWHRRTPLVVIFDRGSERGIERLNVSRMGMKDFFVNAWDSRAYDQGQSTEGQWACLARIVGERNPRKIGINESQVIWGADGLSAGLKKKLTETLGPPYRERLQSAEAMATRWLETLLPEEFDLLEQAIGLSRAIIAETYSNRVITPGVTSVDDLVHHYWQRVLDLGLEKAFNPSFNIVRSPADREKYGSRDRIIRRGDLIHCDVGLTYLRYHTDHQELAYVLRRGEKDIPEAFKKAMSEGNRLQDVFIGEFRTGRTGNQLLKAILEKARKDGIPNPRVYSHALGYCPHDPGPLIGLPEEQENTGGRGDVALVPNSAFAAEMSVGFPVPEWNGAIFTLGLEQDIVFDGTSAFFLGGRQQDFHLIK